MTEYFYNKTEVAFAETRIVRQNLKLQFIGAEPHVFKPGLTFFGEIAVTRLFQRQFEKSLRLLRRLGVL